jgi:hypothetical protein
MIATIYFKRMSEEQIQQLNSPGNSWGSFPWSKAYADLTMIGYPGHDSSDAVTDLVVEAAKLGLYEIAAEIEEKDPNPELIWKTLQNLLEPWTENRKVICHTDWPRSMDVGDVILAGDGRSWVCAAFGFIGTSEEEFLRNYDIGSKKGE